MFGSRNIPSRSEPIAKRNASKRPVENEYAPSEDASRKSQPEEPNGSGVWLHSNGKLERFHGTIKKECIRPACPRNYEEAVRQISTYVKHYNEVRLHSAIGYITPADCLCGLGDQIHAERDRKLEEARVRRRTKSNDKSLALVS